MLVLLIPGGSVFAAEDLLRETKNNFTPHPFIQPDLTNGAFTKSYPIAVPPGRNGIEPDLKLTYSSQAGRPDSIVGYGWSLNIPYIERLNKKGVDNLYNQDFAHTYFYSSLSGELLYSTTTSPLSSVLGFSFSAFPLSYVRFFSKIAFAQGLPAQDATSSDPLTAPLTGQSTSTTTATLVATSTTTDTTVATSSDPIPALTEGAPMGTTSVATLSVAIEPPPEPLTQTQSPASASPSPPTRFAEIDDNGIVKRVLVIDRASLDMGLWGDPKNWIPTSVDGSIKKNYAGKGYTYDKTSDAFVAPKPESEATFDTTTARWILTLPQVTSATSTPL